MLNRARYSTMLFVICLALTALASSAQDNVTTAEKLQSGLPVDNIRLPPGFRIEVWASGLPGARSLALGNRGTVFVGARGRDAVYAVIDKGNKREVITIADGLQSPNGVAFKDGDLYVAEISRVLRFDDIEDHLYDSPQPVVVYDDLPEDKSHGWKFIAFGPDGKLYVPIGAPCNICEPGERHAQIRRIMPDGRNAEVYARGVRNTVGFDWHPVTGELWFTDNGRDWLGDDLPGDELNPAPVPGLHFGFPYCHQGDIPDPEFGAGGSCSAATPPAVNLGAHVASIGMRFYTGTMFPPEFRNRIIIAEHGSWNRSSKAGYRLVWVDVSADTPSTGVFADGWLQGENVWGRPVDVQIMADGAILVSDDQAGVLYRIDYVGMSM